MVRAQRGRPIEILFVGDEPADVRATRAALRDDGIANAMSIVPTVAEALNYLHRRGDYAEVDRPDVVLLDHDSAGEASSELHVAAAAVGEEGPVTVVGLRSDSCPDAIDDETSYPCIEKPVDGVEFIDVVVGTGNIWVRIVSGPQREGLADRQREEEV